jgi:hypothetical protein
VECTTQVVDDDEEEDILTRALGKKEHPGRVRGQSKYVSKRACYKQAKDSTNPLVQSLLAEIKDMKVKSEARDAAFEEWKAKVEQMIQGSSSRNIQGSNEPLDAHIVR